MPFEKRKKKRSEILYLERGGGAEELVIQILSGFCCSMGIPDSSLLDLKEKVRSWISWRASDLLCVPGEFEMPDNSCKMCCECEAKFSESCNGYCCQGCGRWMCGRCNHGNVESKESIKACKFCDGIIVRHGCGRKYSEKVHPSVSPQESPEPPSPSFNTEKTDCSRRSELVQSDRLADFLESRDCGYSPDAVTSRSQSMISFSAHLPPVSVRRSPSR